MSNDIPDYMRGFDINEDWGFTAVPDKPVSEPTIDPEKIDSTNIEVAKVKQGVDDVKSMMNEIMNIVAENKQKAETEVGEDIVNRFKAIEKIARKDGYGKIFDDWTHDLDFMHNYKP